MFAVAKLIVHEADGKRFHDFIIKECCRTIIKTYGDKEEFRKKPKKSGVKEVILIRFEAVRQKHGKDESYLRLSFSEDVQRSHGELLKIISCYKERNIEFIHRYLAKAKAKVTSRSCVRRFRLPSQAIYGAVDTNVPLKSNLTILHLL